MITDADVKKLKETFVTKDDLKNDIQNFSNKIIEAMGEMFSGLEAKLTHKADTSDLNDQQRQIDNHETRIGDLEAKPN